MTRGDSLGVNEVRVTVEFGQANTPDRETHQIQLRAPNPKDRPKPHEITELASELSDIVYRGIIDRYNAQRHLKRTI